jgi:hypothetical protein
MANRKSPFFGPTPPTLAPKQVARELHVKASPHIPLKSDDAEAQRNLAKALKLKNNSNVRTSGAVQP